jgi:hypothetical protein
MKNQYVLTLVILAGASCMISAVTRAQKAPPAKDTPKKSEPTPRLADGHPDFSGVWYQGIVPDINHMPPNVSYREYDPKVTPQESPSFQSWAVEKIKLMGATTGGHLELLVPNLECLPRGALSYFIGSGYSIQLVQNVHELALLTESDTTWRYMPTDGRPHPKYMDPQWNGNSVGHWEGDTLVVDTVSLDTRAWIGYPEYLGWFPSPEVHYIERMSRPTADRFVYQAIVEDPKVLTKPWVSVPRVFTWAHGKSIEERYNCTNMSDYQQLSPQKKPVTAEGNDERFWDDQEYERLRKQYGVQPSSYVPGRLRGGY